MFRCFRFYRNHLAVHPNLVSEFESKSGLDTLSPGLMYSIWKPKVRFKPLDFGGEPLFKIQTHRMDTWQSKNGDNKYDAKKAVLHGIPKFV